jgi:hypothetical protein
MRQVGTNGTKVTVMEQVVGFKIGASIWNAASSQSPYNYDAPTYVSTDAADHYNYTLAPSVHDRATHDLGYLAAVIVAERPCRLHRCN